MESYTETMKTLIVSLTEQYCETDIHEYTSLESIGYDEVDMLELAAMVEDEFNIELSDTSIELSMNARDWASIIIRIRENVNG